MNKQLLYMCIFLCSVFISSVSQIGLKKASKKEHKNLFFEYCNVLVISSYFMFFISTLITVYALKYIKLSYAPVLEAAGYVFVPILSRFFLNEKLTKRKLLGMAVIILGIVIFSIEF